MRPMALLRKVRARGQTAAVPVYVSVGSNVDPAQHIRAALDRLRQRFGPLRLSSVYRNRAEGFKGADFLNMVVGFTTHEPACDVVDFLETLHGEAGRVRGPDRFAPRTLDLDLLLYGDQVIDELQVPRTDITLYSFVLGPLAEIAPDLRHPVTGQAIAQIWAGFDQASHPLHKLPVNVI